MMFSFGFGLLTAIELAFWGALALVLLWTYRHLCLPSVPWLAAYHLLGLAIGWLPVLVIYLHHRQLVAQGVRFIEICDGLGTSQYVASISTLSDVMVAWFLVAEFAFVISKSSIGEGLSIPKLTYLPREHATGFGIALVGSCLLALGGELWLATHF